MINALEYDSEIKQSAPHVVFGVCISFQEQMTLVTSLMGLKSDVELSLS